MVCLGVKEDARLQQANFYLLLLGKYVTLKVTGTKLSSNMCNRTSTVFFQGLPSISISVNSEVFAEDLLCFFS
jgi:hypothetical protein